MSYGILGFRSVSVQRRSLQLRRLEPSPMPVTQPPPRLTHCFVASAPPLVVRRSQEVSSSRSAAPMVVASGI